MKIASVVLACHPYSSTADRVECRGWQDLDHVMWSFDNRELCKLRTEAEGKPVTEHLSLRAPAQIAAAVRVGFVCWSFELSERPLGVCRSSPGEAANPTGYPVDSC